MGSRFKFLLIFTGNRSKFEIRARGVSVGRVSNVSWVNLINLCAKFRITSKERTKCDTKAMNMTRSVINDHKKPFSAEKSR